MGYFYWNGDGVSDSHFDPFSPKHDGVNDSGHSLL